MVENKSNEQLGEDPQILADIAKATQELANFLKLHSIEVDYCEADWRDTESLILSAHSLMLRHPGWWPHYIGGDTFGIDSNYVFFTSKPVSDEVVEKIGDLIVNEGAELKEPPVPKCPKCGKAIECLTGSYPAAIPAVAHVVGGELCINWMDGIKMGDVISDEQVESWHCPLCDELLFRTGEEAEMAAFLKCEFKEVDNGPHD